jgi:hypothetical protein
VSGLFQQQMEREIKKLYTKLSKLLTEIFATKVGAEGSLQRQLLVISGIRHNLGEEYSKPLLDKLHNNRGENTLSESHNTMHAQTTSKGKNPDHYISETEPSDDEDVTDILTSVKKNISDTRSNVAIAKDVEEMGQAFQGSKKLSSKPAVANIPRKIVKIPTIKKNGTERSLRKQ